jgi:hypothetical protein
MFAPSQLIHSLRGGDKNLARKPRQTCRSCQQEQKVYTKYKITFEQRKEMEKSQEGRCLICKTHAKLCVDHCHKSLKVRGLLCRSCNLGLGYFKDNCSFLSEAILYLNK